MLLIVEAEEAAIEARRPISLKIGGRSYVKDPTHAKTSARGYRATGYYPYGGMSRVMQLKITDPQGKTVSRARVWNWLHGMVVIQFLTARARRGITTVGIADYTSRRR